MYTAVVIGCGYIGSRYDEGRADADLDPLSHAGGYTFSADTRLVAGVDPVPEQRNRFAARWHVPTYASIEQMVSEVRPDLWSICTQPDSHLALVKAAVECGARGILCEKPMALSITDAIQIVHVCEAAGTPLAVNHSRRFDGFHQDVVRRIRAGEWGRVERVLIHYVRGIANYGSHAFDLVRFLLSDDIQWISAWDELGEQTADPSLTVRGQTCGGIPFMLVPERREHYDSFEVDVWASAGRLTITHLGRGAREYHVGPSPHWDEPAVLLESPTSFAPGMRGMMLNAIANLIAHIEMGTPINSTGADGVAALTAIEAARRSAARNGEPVNVQELVELNRE